MAARRNYAPASPTRAPAKPVQPQQPTNTTVASTAAPATPAAPNNPAPVDPAIRVKADLDAGMAWAKDAIKDGSLGRLNDTYKGQVDDLLALQKDRLNAPGLTDPRAQEMNDLLALQKGQLNGMTPEEMRAAKEQGQAGINRQLASNMRSLGGAAAANGVRGGAAAGLQAGAMNQALASQGDLQRKLILDNLNQKNIAMDRYGNTLGRQQATELDLGKFNTNQQNTAYSQYGNTLANQQGVNLGIDKFNIDQGNKETLGRLGAAFQYGGLIDSYGASDDAKALANKHIDLSEKALEMLLKGGGAAGGEVGRGGQTTSAAAAGHKDTYGTDNLSTMVKKGPDGKPVALSEEEARNLPTEKFAQEHGYSSFSEVPQDLIMSPDGQKALQATMEMGVTTKDMFDRTFGSGGAHGKSIICTEAFHQGLINEETWRVTQRYRKLLTLREYRGYLHWARPVVARMKQSPAFAKKLAPYIRRMIQAERFALGEVSSLTLGERSVAVVVKVLNYSGAALRSLSLRYRAMKEAA